MQVRHHGRQQHAFLNYIVVEIKCIDVTHKECHYPKLLS